jgi:hypothetical protein
MEQRKQNIRLFISFLVLTSALIVTLFLKNQNDSSAVDKNLYRKADLKKVDKIVMESAMGKVSLEYQANQWKVNNEFDADRNLVEVLFATLKQAEPKRPLASSIQDSVTTALQKNGVKVSLYTENNLAESFYAGGNPAKTEAYFHNPESKASHVVTIPGYRVYVSGIFELAAPNWREKLVFDFNWRNFKKLDASFINPKGNFEVLVEKNVAILKNVAEPDTARLNTFLDQVSLLTVDEYLDQPEIRDSLQKTEPVATFLIEDIAKRTYELKIYTEGKQFFAVVQGNNLAVIDQRKVIPLLRPKEFFVKR